MMLLRLPTTLLIFLTTALAVPFHGLSHKPQSLPIPPSFLHDGDNPYEVRPDLLRDIITCPGRDLRSVTKPVLLVHGSGLSGRDSFLDSYVPALKEKGYHPCYLDLPSQGAGDMQLSAVYIAYNLHYLSWLAGGNKVNIIAHGQGATMVQWAFQFFPSIKHAAERFIGLAPLLAGTDAEHPQNACQIDQDRQEPDCYPYVWQQAADSNFMRALHHKYHVAQVPTTLIFSEDDEVSMPAYENALLAGATTISVQELCRTRTVTHEGMLTDPAAFELVIFALHHGGQASLRLAAPNAMTICARSTAPFMQDRAASKGRRGQAVLANINFIDSPQTNMESPIKNYARLRNQ